MASRSRVSRGLPRIAIQDTLQRVKQPAAIHLFGGVLDYRMKRVVALPTQRDYSEERVV